MRPRCAATRTRRPASLCLRSWSACRSTSGSFVHGIALKGGVLMAGELHSARSSADIDATTGRGRRVDPDQVVEDLRRAGRGFGLRLEGEPDWTLGGLIVRFRFDSLTDAGTAKLEVSVREDLVFAVRDALLMSRNGVCGPSRSRRSRRSNSWPRNSGRSSSELSRGDLLTYIYISSTRAGTSTQPSCDELSTPSCRSLATSAGGQTFGEQPRRDRGRLGHHHGGVGRARASTAFSWARHRGGPSPAITRS